MILWQGCILTCAHLKVVGKGNLGDHLNLVFADRGKMLAVGVLFWYLAEVGLLCKSIGN